MFVFCSSFLLLLSQDSTHREERLSRKLGPSAKTPSETEKGIQKDECEAQGHILNNSVLGRPYCPLKKGPARGLYNDPADPRLDAQPGAAL